MILGKALNKMIEVKTSSHKRLAEKIGKKNGSADRSRDQKVSEESITVIPNENIKCVNKILIEVSSVGRPTCAIMPITVFGN